MRHAIIAWRPMVSASLFMMQPPANTSAVRASTYSPVMRPLSSADRLPAANRNAAATANANFMGLPAFFGQNSTAVSDHPRPMNGRRRAAVAGFLPQIARGTRLAPLAGMRLDFRAALRSITRTPGFFLSAVLTLGLGLGAVVTVVRIAGWRAWRFRTRPRPAIPSCST